MMRSGCENVADPAAFGNEEAPFEHDVLGNRQDALLEHRPYLVRQPIVEFRSLVDVGNAFDAVTNLGEVHYTDVELFERLRDYERNNLRRRLATAKLRKDVCVEQPARHKITSAPASACVPVRCRGRDTGRLAWRRRAPDP
jgi:hypothetical protein